MTELVNRPEYQEQLVENKDVDLVKIVTGIRRCGKSSLLELFNKPPYRKWNRWEPYYPHESGITALSWYKALPHPLRLCQRADSEGRKDLSDIRRASGGWALGKSDRIILYRFRCGYIGIINLNSHIICLIDFITYEQMQYTILTVLGHSWLAYNRVFLFQRL